MEKRLRYSRQRERIYEYLLTTEEHPSAEDIYSGLREELPGLSLGTVYRNLKLLEDLGKVRRVAALQGTERYDAICADHVHFVCQDCGVIRDMAGVDPLQLLGALPADAGYRFSKLDLTVTGQCPQCTRRVSN